MNTDQRKVPGVCGPTGDGSVLVRMLGETVVRSACVYLGPLAHHLPKVHQFTLTIKAWEVATFLCWPGRRLLRRIGFRGQ